MKEEKPVRVEKMKVEGRKVIKGNVVVNVPFEDMAVLFAD